MAVSSVRVWYPFGPTGPSYNLAFVQDFVPLGNGTVQVRFTHSGTAMSTVIFDQTAFETAYQAYLDQA